MRFIAIEMSDDRTNADDRPLGKCGDFLTGSYSDSDVMQFASADSALMVASLARNARPGATIETIPQRKRA